MAKVSGPLMSSSASGSIGPRLTFSRRKSGQQVRIQRPQKIDVPSLKQTDNQSLYRVIFARWASFSAAEKEDYNVAVKVKNLRMTGWNYFLKLAFASPLTYLGLCGYWGMSGIEPGKIKDTSKNLNVGYLMPSWPDNCPSYVAGKNKKTGKAILLDGYDDYVHIPVSDILQPAAVTVSAWVRLTSDNPQQILQYNKASGQSYGLCINLFGDNPGKMNFAFYNDDWRRVDDTQNYIPNIWTHYVGTFDGEFLKIYRDGVLAATTPYAGALDYSEIQGLDFGCYALTYYFLQGIIDEVSIYNRALSAPEIWKLYDLFR